MKEYVREGDTLYIESISRLGRSTKDLLNIIDTLTEKSSSNSVSVRALRLLRLRGSTQGVNPLKLTGRGSVSSMGNGGRRTSQAGTLCGEWACRLILFTAVSGSMKPLTALPSLPLLESHLRRRSTPLRAVQACEAKN